MRDEVDPKSLPTPQGSQLPGLARAPLRGHSGVFTGGNIPMGSRSAREAVDGWMSSESGHCTNIMDERYHSFGAATGVGGTTYWTQNFGP